MHSFSVPSLNAPLAQLRLHILLVISLQSSLDCLPRSIWLAVSQLGVHLMEYKGQVSVQRNRMTSLIAVDDDDVGYYDRARRPLFRTGDLDLDR